MFDALLSQLLKETTERSLPLFSPELTLLAGIVLSLVVRIGGWQRSSPTSWIVLWAALTAFCLGLLQWHDFSRVEPRVDEYFAGMLAFDRFAAFARFLLLLFLVLVVALTVLTGIPDDDDAPDFYTLLLGSTIGLLLMPGANHLLMVFLSIEMTSVPGYVLVGFLKGRPQSSEAALKFVVYGAGSAGILLYGVSLIAGLLGTAELPEIALRMQEVFGSDPSSAAMLARPEGRTLILALLMVLVGFAFKLATVPFHFWCPDAFQGASAEVAGFLSVATKIGVFALLVRTSLALLAGGGPGLEPTCVGLGVGVGVLAAVTATFGNLAAYPQQNLKRLLAYSTIAQAGYMLMAVSALIVLLNAGETDLPGNATLSERSTRAVEGLLYYLVVYLFMNLGAFAVVALVRNITHSEEVDDLRGAGYTAPAMALGLAVCFFSLIGLPPLGGFIGKLFVFTSLFEAGYVHPGCWAILAIGVVNTVVSLFYYARVLRAMYFTAPTSTSVVIPTWTWTSGFVLVLTVPVVILGLHVQLVSQAARTAALVLFP